MNIEQTKEAIKVMQAFVDGKQIEYAQIAKTPIWHSNSCPGWDWGHMDYRVKPAAKLRPWEMGEVPIGAWMREVGVDQIWMIVNTMNKNRRKDWLDTCEYSIDLGKTWLKCGVGE